MNESTILRKLRGLSELMASSPLTGTSTKASDGLYLPMASTEKPSVPQSMDHLQLQIKYLLFDLEATRRENRYLRQMLENRPRRPRDTDSGEDKGNWR
jgi:hypothetical protein